MCLVNTSKSAGQNESEAKEGHRGWAVKAVLSPIPAGEPSANDLAMFFQLTHTRAPETTQKNDFYSFCSALSDTKEQNVRHFEEDLSKAKEWGQARVEARIQEAEDNLAKKKTIKKSALEIAYDATLESFIKQSERCWNCKLFYSADENDDSSCK
eukprot:CAMPEP_0179463590 /NCGR_PEP_ID=MMETSP0799-20121207/45619_1 /TAXON_ID=46947 /ORGANISM="Geminigera cryophila, Strain CCMP2564" /LENGTH=154 /DNA_ID=CAMNT_0021266951 /DNA_START=271 /DNA_END=736 /DNA_ORIENTATION=+